jgi:hypothetical protein
MKLSSFRCTTLAATVLAMLLAAAPATRAQDSDPRTVLDKGSKATGLAGADVPPWHLKANYTFYDPAKGNVTESGTFEEWATGPHTWHRVYNEKKLSGSEWSTAHSKQFRLKENKLDVIGLDKRVATILVDPAFQAANYKPSVDAIVQAGTFAGLVLDCVVATSPSQAAGAINPDLLFPRLCFDVKDFTLRYITTADTMSVYSDFKPYGVRSIANKVEIKPYNRLGTQIDITLLEPLSAADQAQVAPPGNAIPLPYAHQTGDAPLVPAKITECAYPIDARNKSEFGVVSIPVIIRKDGSVKNNGFPMGPPELANAANDCVGNWKFEPFILDGEAIDVSDTLLYNFDGKPFKGTIGIGSEPPPPPPTPAKK